VKTRRSPEDAQREGIAFALLHGIGGAAFRKGIERAGSAAAAFREHGNATLRADALRKADDTLTCCRESGITILLQGEASYPESLLDLAQPPSLLYALGDAALGTRRRVGIVGTRHSSPAGDRIAQQMAAAVVRAGAVVVSGMAFGIDAAAHRGALDAGGGTIAVLGGGVDVPYPPTHAALHRRIATEGLIVAESPVGSRPTLGAFPKRNRIIAALSETLIVIEAGERSGALITARLALELGRTVAAVPGPIDSPRHVGSNRLLSEGASFIAQVEDVISIAGLETTRGSPAQTQAPETAPASDPSHAAILNAVRAGASDVEDLARSTRLKPRDFAMALSSLELAGDVLVTAAGEVTLANRA